MSKRTIGRFKGRAVAGSQTFGRAGTGTEQIGLACEVAEGEFKGRQFPWVAPLNEQANVERAMRSLVYCGWDGVVFDEKLNGLGSKDAAFTLEEDTFAKPGEEPVTRIRVAWIDDPDSAGVMMKDTYDSTQRKDFFARLQGAVSECRSKGVIPKPGRKPAPAQRSEPKPQNSGGVGQQSSRANEDTGEIPF